MSKAEHYWEKAKEIVRKEYKHKEKSPKFWALVVGITKKMMGIKKEGISFEEYMLAEELSECVSDEQVRALIGELSRKTWAYRHLKTKGALRSLQATEKKITKAL